MIIDEKVKTIIEWQEALASYSDEYFFEIVRIYLGAVRTPFNKQDIVKKIAGLLRKEENKKVLLSYLTKEDVKILSAIKIIPDCTAKKLYLFFNSENLYERLANLEDRLIVYHVKNPKDESILLKINPMLKEEINSFTSTASLFKSAVNVEKKESSFIVTKEFIAALLSYIAEHGDCFKNDGNLKKKNLTEITEIFGQDKIDCVKVIFDALKNLTVLYESGKGYEIEWSRMETLCERDFIDVLCYICVSAVIKFARSNLILYAELLKNLLIQIKDKYFSSEEIIQLSYLLKEKKGSDSFTPGRFSSMMARVFESSDSTSQIMEGVLDKALTLGLIFSAKDLENEREVFSSAVESISSGSECRVLNLTPSGSVNILPGLNLLNLVQLAKFMQIVRYDTVSSFEINKKTAVRAFNLNISVTGICEIISRFSLYTVPQNLLLNLNEWSDSFSSTESYFGFVLKVNDRQQEIQIEKNPVLAPHILKLLAPGLYLFDFEDRLQAQSFIDRSGLDFIGEIKNSNKESVKLMLQKLYSDKNDFCSDLKEEKTITEESLNYAEDFKQKLFEELKKLNLTQEQFDGLEDRINRKLIINSEQLRGESVRFEIREASAMDHTGKIHVIESAMNNNDLLLISLRNSEKILAQIRSFNKKYEEASVRVFIEKLNVEEDIYIKNIMHVKRLRNPSVFVSKASARW